MAKEDIKRREYSIRCMEIGDVDCPWEGSASSEEELMRDVERHGREQHQWVSLPEDIKNKARAAIRRKAA